MRGRKGAVGLALVLAATGAACTTPDGASRSGADRDGSTAPVARVWPGPDTTGPPAETVLSPYTGECRVTVAGTHIDAKQVDCDLVVLAADVRITRSETRRIEVGPAPASVVIEDTTVDAGEWVGAAVGLRALTLRRVEVRGGQHSVQCEQSCVVEDSWLHAQSLPPDEPRHNNAFISNGGSDMLVRGNVLSCDPSGNAVDGGCTANLSLFGDFEAVTDVTIEDNLFVATPGGWCGSFGHNPGKPYGTASARIVVKGNVFERGSTGLCGVYGAATSFRPDAVGNVWDDNLWDDETRVEP